MYAKIQFFIFQSAEKQNFVCRSTIMVNFNYHKVSIIDSENVTFVKLNVK